MTENLEPKMSNFFAINAPTVGANFRNSGLLRAMRASNLNLSAPHSFLPELIIGSFNAIKMQQTAQ